MQAKDILNKVHQIKKDIKIKKQLIKTYKTIAEGLQASRYSDMPKNTNKNNNPMGSAIDKALELEDEIKELETKLSKLNQLIFLVIQRLDNKEYQLILLERYINEKSWGEIQSMMCYSKSSIHTKHNLALVEFYLELEKVRT